MTYKVTLNRDNGKREEVARFKTKKDVDKMLPIMKITYVFEGDLEVEEINENNY